MLAIEVTFLTGRYVATAYNTRAEGEWPPHPARLFSALVATHFAAEASSGEWLTKERAVLEWLEQQGAPSIRASQASVRDAATVFVPVNDVGLTDVEEEARQLDAARTAFELAEASPDAKAVKKIAATVRNAEGALRKAIVRATSVPAKALDPRYGRRVLPEYRVRQPRTFPSVTPEQARVTYMWPDANPTEGQRALLDALLGRVVRLGHSSSLVSIRLVDDSVGPTWTPALDGEITLRVVESGQLAALERAFERHREIEPRVMPAMFQLYTRKAAAANPAVPPTVFSDDWLVLRRVGGLPLPMTASAGVARQIRRTLMSYAASIPEVLSGHTNDKRPSEQAHLAIVPLPFVGHEHASGLLLGVALILPRSTSVEDRRLIYGTIDRWEEKYRREDEDTPGIQLNLGKAGEMYLERVAWGAVSSSLTADVWCRPATVWSSVTPMALDQNPGDLRSRDSVKLGEATAEAVATICRACERIGLPRPMAVEVLPAPAWAGAAKARQYPPFPDDPERTQRVLTHVRLAFAERIRGPILLGAGRYLGLGLFRPEVSQ